MFNNVELLLLIYGYLVFNIKKNKVDKLANITKINIKVPQIAQRSPAVLH